MGLRRRALAALLAALVVATAAAGCGGDAAADNAYVERVGAAQRSYVARFDAVLRRLTPTSTPAQDRDTLAAFGQATRRFATALRAAGPPDGVRAEHGRLVAAVTGYQRRLARAAERLRSGSVADRARARTELSSGAAATQAAITDAVAAINAALRD